MEKKLTTFREDFGDTYLKIKPADSVSYRLHIYSIWDSYYKKKNQFSSDFFPVDETFEHNTLKAQLLWISTVW